MSGNSRMSYPHCKKHSVWLTGKLEMVCSVDVLRLSSQEYTCQAEHRCDTLFHTLYVAVINNDQEQLWEGRVYFSLHFRVTIYN